MATQIFPFFKLPRELRDSIYEAACAESSPVKDAESTALEGVYKGFSASKALWLEYTEVCHKQAIIRHHFTVDYGTSTVQSSGIAMPTDECTELILVVDMNIPARFEYDNNNGSDELWQDFTSKLGMYTDATSIAIEIHIVNRDGRPTNDRDLHNVWYTGLAYLHRAGLRMRQGNLKQLCVLIDKSYIFWADKTWPGSVTTSNFDSTHPVYIWWGSLNPSRLQVQALKEFVWRMHMPM